MDRLKIVLKTRELKERTNYRPTISWTMRRTRAASEPHPRLPEGMFNINNRQSLSNKRTGGDGFASVTVNLISERMEGMSNGVDDAQSEAAMVKDDLEEGKEAIDEEEDLDDSLFTSDSSSVDYEPTRLPNIFIPCTKCHELINLCRLQGHRNLHSALRTFQFSYEQRPTTIKALVKRRRLLITRMQESSATKGQDAFGDKQLHKLNTTFEILKNEIDDSREHLRVHRDCAAAQLEGSGLRLSCRRAVGLCVEANAQWKQVMEDVHTFQDHYINTDSCFLAIYDGYRGENTAQQCAAHLHVYLKEELKDVLSQKAEDIQKRQVAFAFRRAYFRIEQLLLLKSDKERLHSRWSGCSAVTCVLTSDTCYLANAGNVGAILIRSNDVVKVLTRKHDLYDKKERARVRQLNGTIVKSEKCALINGALSVTRGIGNLGDGDLKSCIINEPQVKCVSLDCSDQLLFIASSGFWKVFDYEESAYLISGFMSQVKEEAKRQLLEKLMPQTDENKSDSESYHENDDDKEEAAVVERPIKRNRSYPCVIRHGFHRDSDVSPLEEQELGRAEEMEAEAVSVEEKEQLLAKALAQRLVKSALLAGSMDNITVLTVLLPGFSLVPWYTVTRQILDNLDTLVTIEKDTWPSF